jgi:hypothetical protein
MGGVVLRRDAVAVVEEPIELAAHESAGDQVAEGRKRQRIIDVLLQVARRRTVRLNPVRVLPASEGTGALNIPELHPGFVVAVFGFPTQPKGSHAQTQDDASAVFDATGALENFKRFPGRGKTLNGPGLSVPSKDRLSRGVNMGAARK